MHRKLIKPSTSREFLLTDMEIPATTPCHQPTVDQLTRQFQDQLAQYQSLPNVEALIGKVEQVILAIGVNQNLQADTIEPFMDVAHCLDSLATQFKGVWTFHPTTAFLLILPTTSTADIKTVAQLCQQQITLFAKQIVTLGIAFSPSPENHPTDTLANALKAARHASFFGPGASAYFDAVSLNISGDDHYRQGKTDLAIDEYKTGLKIDPQNANLLNSLGVCHAISGNYGEAQNTFQKVVDLDPTEVMAVYNLGLVMLLTEKEGDALTQFKSAQGIDDTIFEIHFQKARIYQKRCDAEKAVASLNRAITLKPDAAAAHRLLGDEMIRQQKLKTAKKNYTQALRYHPNDAEALSALGTLYGKLNENLDLAELYLTQSVTICPEDGQLFFALGSFYQQTRQMDKAAEAFQKAYALGIEKGREQADQIRTLEDETKENLQQTVAS